MESRAREWALGVTELPTVDGVTSKVLRIVRDPDYTIDELTAAIRFDPGLSAKMLKLCNSSYFALRSPVRTIQEAVVYLGQRRILNVVLTTCARDSFRDRGDAYGMTPGEIWRHAVGCALACEEVARHAGDAAPERAFTAGLLHDVGKTVLNDRLLGVRSEFEELRSQGINLPEAERQLLGVDHAQVGGALVAQWGLPPEYEVAIRDHHQPSKNVGGDPLSMYVHVADAICLMAGVGHSSHALGRVIEEVALRTLGLDWESLCLKALALEPLLERAQEFLEL